MVYDENYIVPLICHFVSWFPFWEIKGHIMRNVPWMINSLIHCQVHNEDSTVLDWVKHSLNKCFAHLESNMNYRVGRKSLAL